MSKTFKMNVPWVIPRMTEVNSEWNGENCITTCFMM